jgi:hypothetical protein
VGCGPRLNLWLEEHKRPGGVNQMQLEFCSNIYHSMSEKLKLTNGIVMPYYQDLLMEEGRKISKADYLSAVSVWSSYSKTGKCQMQFF